MAGRFGSVSRSLMSTARSSSFLRSAPPSAAHRLRPPPSFARRRPSISPIRNFGELGCVQSLLPFGNAAAIPCLTAHLSRDERAFSELSNGTFCRSCQVLEQGLNLRISISDSSVRPSHK